MMIEMKKVLEEELEKFEDEKILRGKRIENIRENELVLRKTDLAPKLGISSQFLGLVEKGKANLNYNSLKLLRDLSNHSADFILYGLDDSILVETKKYLDAFTERELMEALETIKVLSTYLRTKNYKHLEK
jgi:DNA-binding transcriptional regulator YiaG